MSRPWRIWLVLLCCLGLLLAAMGWVSVTVLRLDQESAQARAQAALEENVRLALWRMDAAVTPVITREVARGPISYLYQQWPAAEPPVLLYFYFEGKKTLHLSDGDPTRTRFRSFFEPGEAFTALPPVTPEPAQVAVAPALVNPAQSVANRADRNVQQALNAQEFQARNLTAQNAMNRLLDQIGGEPVVEIRTGAMQPVWLRGELLLAQRMRGHGSAGDESEDLLGCWIDWPKLRQSLLDSVRDLLPEARLEPAPAGKRDSLALASLPVVLVPGRLHGNGVAGLTPVQLSLLVAWACVLLAAAAVVLLLRGALQLSERRGAFVSAVTHELRTPLTTFRMYTEMLAEGMVTEPDKQQRYFETLRSEAERLDHLVQNVLGYARLERGRAPNLAEAATVAEVLARTLGRLAERATQAQMEFVTDIAPETLVLRPRCDAEAVERILFNLVDNACKYARAATDRRILLTAERSGRRLCLRLRDHGPGIAPQIARNLFVPFSKSARQAAESAPGVGLGLALCRRLARGMRGDLRFDPQVQPGAGFELQLPLAAG